MTKKLDKATDQKLDALVPKLMRLLGMLTSNADGEVINSAHMLLQVLTNAGLDIHVLLSRIEHGKQLEDKTPSASQIQQAYEKGYAEGHANGAEQGRRSAVIAAAMPMAMLDTTDVGPGINGHNWLEILQHCATNKHRIFRDRDREFVDSALERVAVHGKPLTPPMAKWLTDIFNQRFAGRID
jgi:flagellar biosynthesis/type III secretory pathway protein FliH